MIYVTISGDEGSRLISKTIREDVFIRELGVNKDSEFDGLDKYSRHAVLFENYEPVGCARIRKDQDSFIIEKIALMKKVRGSNYGKLIIDKVIEYCKSENILSLKLNCNHNFIGYFNKFGFVERGIDTKRDLVDIIIKLN